MSTVIEEEQPTLTGQSLLVTDQDNPSDAASRRSSQASEKQAFTEDANSSKAEPEEEEVSLYRSHKCWWFRAKQDPNNYKTLETIDPKDMTEAEKELNNEDWKDFKEDVSMKTLINELDKTIKRRRRLFIADTKEGEEKIKNFRQQYSRFKTVKLIALALYMLLPIMEKPGWCLHDSDIDTDTKMGYWYCNDEKGTITNSNIPKLPANATNAIYIVCLHIIFFYTKARDTYRLRDQKGDTVTLQLWLCVLAVLNLFFVMVMYNINWTTEQIDNNLFVQFGTYPYLNAFIRPLLFTLTVRSVKSFWRRYLSVMNGSLSMVVFIGIYVFYFAWMGNRLFAGTIEGVENFSTLNDSFFYMFVLLTTSNYPDVMLPSYGQQRRYAAFFILFLIVGLFMFMNLLLAIFYSNYQERVEDSIDRSKDARNNYLIHMFRQYDKKKKGYIEKDDCRSIIEEIHSLANGKDTKIDAKEMDLSDLQFEQIFNLLDQDKNGKMEPKEILNLLQAYETWLYEKQYKSAMEDLYSDSKKETISTDESTNTRWKRVLKKISSPQYELAMNIVTIINVFIVFIRALQQSASEQTIQTWIILVLTINLIMLLEMVADIAVAGPRKAYQYHFRVWPETMCQILNIPAMVHYFQADGDFQKYNYTVKIFEVIVFIRMLKLLTLLYEIKTMRVIFETLKNLLGPLNNLIIVMLTIFYLFAQIGMYMFGGDITSNSPEIVHDSSIPDNYYLINFNDLVSSYITLFILIVVNNWFVIVQMCVDIKGGNLYYRYFFVVFYYFGVIIGLNIIIAFAIDMYAAVQRLEDQKEANRKYLIELANQQNSEFKNKNKVDESKNSDDSHSYGSDDLDDHNLAQSHASIQ